MKIEFNTCQDCKHLAYIDGKTGIGRCSKLKTMVNTMSQFTCFANTANKTNLVTASESRLQTDNQLKLF